jgi:predicted ribosomally synthesized peptide with SipW-like signal peptide
MGVKDMKNKTLWAVLLISVALLLVATGVYALFNDTEVSSGNTITGGTLNLQVGSTDPCTATISVPVLKPGDSGNAATWQVQNTGNLAGNLNISLGSITNNENGVSEVEVADGESPTNTVGDMGANVQMAFWMDVDRNGAWSSGDYYLKSDSTKVAWASGSSLPAGAYDFLNNYGSKAWSNIQTNLGNGNIGNFRIEYNLPLSTTNVVQSDNCTFNITFTLVQS